MADANTSDDESFEDGVEITDSQESTKIAGVIHSQLEERLLPYIDLIDSLRSVGIENDFALPAIVVIGDQSSGKSSVLEALSGVGLPRGSGIVTRCPLELRLRKENTGAHWKAVLSYRAVRKEFFDPSLAKKLVEEAQNELAGRGLGVCDELITLEVMSPNVCDLTLIDLPGIARVPVKGQPEDIGSQIKSLIMKFIERSETINMVVVPCNTDIATTEALKMAQEVDPKGKRTVGVLTKPDLIDNGTENNILDIVQNKVFPLRKGYIMVKCRGQKQIDTKMSLDVATQIEKDFFSKHEFFSSLLNKEKATIGCLATKLTRYLVDHIKKILPLLSEKIKRQLWELRSELKEYEEGPPVNPQEAKLFLINILTGFNEKIKRLSLGDLLNEDNLYVQLRAEFKEWNDHLDNSKPSFHQSVKEIKECFKKYRGKELPGFSNYKVFENVLQSHLKRLEGPAIEILTTIKEIILKHFNDVSHQCFQKYPFLLDVAMKKFDNIQSKQTSVAEQRILEQFEMENMVFTQDSIYFKSLNGIVNVPDGKGMFSEDRLPVFDKKSMYPEMLQSYYEIVVQRLADQVPMFILYFMLKETTQLLCTEILTIMNVAEVNEILREDSDVGRRRNDLLARLDRLNIANEKMSNFV